MEPYAVPDGFEAVDLAQAEAVYDDFEDEIIELSDFYGRTSEGDNDSREESAELEAEGVDTDTDRYVPVRRSVEPPDGVRTYDGWEMH